MVSSTKEEAGSIRSCEPTYGRRLCRAEIKESIFRSTSWITSCSKLSDTLIEQIKNMTSIIQQFSHQHQKYVSACRKQYFEFGFQSKFYLYNILRIVYTFPFEWRVCANHRPFSSTRSREGHCCAMYGTMGSLLEWFPSTTLSQKKRRLKSRFSPLISSKDRPLWKHSAP